MRLHDGRRTPKATFSTGFDYVAVLKEELAADRILQDDLIAACDEAIQLLDLIDADGFWSAGGAHDKKLREVQ